MSPKPILLILILLAGRGASVAGQVARPGPDSPWLLAPAFFPAGALVNFVEGDPHKAMPIRVDFAFPDGFPSAIDPGTGTDVRVDLINNGVQPDPAHARVRLGVVEGAAEIHRA